MNKFEGGMPILEKKPEEKKETDLVTKTEEQLLQESLREVAEDLNGVLIESGWQPESFGELKKEQLQDLAKENEVRYIISAQEKLDSEMGVNKSGWPMYWAKRLMPEMGLLPEKVQKVLEYYNENKKFPDGGVNIFEDYIRGRVMVKRFELGKREEMAKLKQDLRDIDVEKEISPEKAKDRRTVYFDESTQSFYIQDKYGKLEKRNISFGDLVGDYAWGIRYQPDKTVAHKVWRKVRKTLALYETREKISLIFNEELSKKYHIGLPTTAIDLDFINKMLNHPKHKFLISGTLAERMITEFLTRVQYNNPQLGMRVEKANALEDVMLKYDLKVVVDKKRGIALESEDMSRDKFVRNKKRVGVQFTIKSHSTGKKEKDLRNAQGRVPHYRDVLKGRVDEVLLVKMPILNTFTNLYKTWIKRGKPSGGPEQYLSREQKLEIFKQATKGLVDLSEEELQKLKV
ncbi:MAG: hypothetical protein HZB99_01060 [Candidatus Harrisonbacteria bacterium]|nr:hypothetical protein [Candidatus Harrisonbacteria bacterium]